MYEWLMGVEYDIYHDVVYFLLYLNCENYMKLLNCYGDVVGVYIGYVHKCCWWIFLHAIGVELLGVSMYWNMLVSIVEVVWEYALLFLSHRSTHCWCRISYPCWWRILCIQLFGLIIRVVYDVQLTSGVTTSQLIWYHTCLESV